MFPLWLVTYSSQQPVFITDTRESPHWHIVPGLEWIKSYACAPLIVNGQVIGFINLNSDQPGALNEEMADRLQAFAVPAALAIQNARLYMAEKSARQIAETLSNAALALAQTLNQDQVLQSMLEHIDHSIAPDISGVGLLDAENRFIMRAANGYTLWTGPGLVFAIPSGSQAETLLINVSQPGNLNWSQIQLLSR